MQCAPTCVPMSCRTLSQGSPKPRPIGPPAPDAHLPLGRSRSTRVCTPSCCAFITQSTFVDHSTPPQVPPYCIPDTLAFKTSLSPLISGLHLADPFFEPCHVSHLAQIHHPCLSPTAPSPSARYPRAANNARSAMDAHHSGTPTPRNGFACQPRSCILNPAFRATSASWSANQASLPHRHPIYAARNDASSCSMPCLELHLTARSCSCCSCLLPCLKALDKQLISFEVRRHAAASCAIRHEHAGCRWLKTPPFVFAAMQWSRGRAM